MWKLFAEKMKFRVNLDQFGLDGYWIDLVPISALPYSEVKTITSLNPQGNETEFLDVLAKCIWGWNLEDEGKALPLPSVDRNILLNLPTALLNYLAEEVGKQQPIGKKRQKGD